MARMVRHEKNSPYEIPEGTELPIYICACGLSKNKPFCDGSHKKTRDENPADVYHYDDIGRARVKTEYQPFHPTLLPRLSPFPRGKGLGVRFLRLVPQESARSESEPPAREESRDSDAPPGWLNYIAEPRHAWPILLIAGVALYLVNLGGYPLYTKGEPREAVTIFDIVHGGGIILPQRAGVEIPSKPLLMHWMAALVSIVAGRVNEFSVRLPSAGLAIAGGIVCYFYVRRLFDDVTALIAAIILATTFQYLQAATGARVDMTLTFFMQVAFFEFILMAEGLTQRRMLLYVAIAFAVLTKGPVGLILPGLVALIWIAAEGRWDFIREMNLVRGTIVVLILAGGWYLAALIEGGPGFFRIQVLHMHLLTFV